MNQIIALNGFKYEIGDIIEDLGAKVNGLIVGHNIDSNRKGYHIVTLRLPNEFLRLSRENGLPEKLDELAPDIDKHETEIYPKRMVEHPFRFRKVGEIEISEEQIQKMKDVPILYAFPGLRQFYEGSGYFQ